MYVEVENGGMDFHSITLETLNEQHWNPVVVIEQTDFQGHHEHTRWVADIHSFSPRSTHAIIQVAEGDQSPGSFAISYVYSWRRWDLSRNKELAVLCICKSPFDPL